MWVRLLMCVNILKGFYKCIYLTRCKRSFWIKTNIVHYGWHFWIKVYLTRSEWLFLDRCLLGTMWVTFSDRSSAWDRKELLSEPGSKLLKSPNTAFSDWYPKKVSWISIMCDFRIVGKELLPLILYRNLKFLANKLFAPCHCHCHSIHLLSWPSNLPQSNNSTKAQFWGEGSNAADLYASAAKLTTGWPKKCPIGIFCSNLF